MEVPMGQRRADIGVDPGIASGFLTVSQKLHADAFNVEKAELKRGFAAASFS